VESCINQQKALKDGLERVRQLDQNERMKMHWKGRVAEGVSFGVFWDWSRESEEHVKLQYQ
jgi:hypothetical protein